jgi:thioesterase domain-containing protein/acyl carrier protein
MSDVATDGNRAGLSLPEMIALWRRLLNLPSVGADDDFFDLGGDSLLALNLLQELERATGRALPITAIYDAATPAKLLDLVAGASHAAFSPLILLKHGDDGPPLFIVHGIGGNVIELEKLGRLIDTARPVYAIQARGVDGGAAPFDKVEDMAEYDLAAIRGTQPRGPYFLAGFSFGGLVAIEMARRLGEAGERVPFLALIDAFPHPGTFPKWLRQLVRARVAIDVFRAKPTREALRFVIERLARRGKASRGGLMLANLPEAGATPALRETYEAGFRALRDYRPRFYPGRVDFFRPAVSIFPVAPRLVWGKLLPGIELHAVGGDHSGMVRGAAASLADAISRALRAAGGS